MAERVCRHCGRVYRGLACPCRKRAWATLRQTAVPPPPQDCVAKVLLPAEDVLPVECVDRTGETSAQRP